MLPRLRLQWSDNLPLEWPSILEPQNRRLTIAVGFERAQGFELTLEIRESLLPSPAEKLHRGAIR